MPSNSPAAADWKSFAGTLLFLVPCAAAWVLASQYLLPEIETIWAAEIPWPGGPSVFNARRPLFRTLWMAAGIFVAAVPILYLLLRTVPKLRMIATGAAFWLANALTFFGMLYMVLAAHICYINARSDLAEDVFGSAQTMAGMASSTRVIMTRLHHLGGKDSRQLSSYNRGEEVMLAPEQAFAVKTVLLDKKSYAWGISRMCGVKYGVSFVFADITPRPEVAICFDCSQFAVFEDGKNVSRESLIAVGKFRELAKQLFPRDSEIQALGTKRR